MDSAAWSALCEACKAEHERLWKKCHPHDPDGANFALQLQSFAIIAGTMSLYMKEREK